MTRDELLDYTYFVVKHIERGVTPAWLVDKYMDSPSPSSATAEEIKPIAYEWHNLKIGHCYVDYVPHLDAKDGYISTPLYSPTILQKAVNEVKRDLTTYMKFNLWTGENCQYYPDTNEWMYFESPMTQQYFKSTDELFDYWTKNIKQ